jgi:signal transduction histidine kinase
VIELLHLQGVIQGLVFDVDGRVAQSIATDRLRAVVGQDMYLMGYVSLVMAHTARHAPMMPTKQDARWRIDALRDFLEIHPDVRQDTAHKLRAILADLEARPRESVSPIDIEVEVLGKERIIEVVVSDFENMRNSLEDKVDALSKEIDIRRDTEHELRRVNEELETRVQERTANLEAANRELRDFAYVVSHDLKAPLRGIARLAHWLAEDYGEHFDKEGHNMVTLLIGRVKRLDNLIDGILQYSRIGRTNTDEKPVDLNHLLPTVIESLSVPEHVRIIIEHELPIVQANATRLSQVFQNLLSNALKFLDKPQGVVTINCQHQIKSWMFRVTDNGPGIEERHQARIFNIFQTLTPRDQRESTGIGLAIVKKIVELYGGNVGVESTVGEGSTFWFTLPTAPSEKSETLQHA